VCGDPRDAAAALIARYEQMDRGCYAAPVGWVDRDGNGEWAVGVRSAEIDGHGARLFAGVGVVADSDPAAELEETRVKLETMLGAIVRP
jgi:isochorismate synthase EntC